MMLENLPSPLRKPLKKVWRQVVPEDFRRELYARRTEKNQILLSVVVPVYKVEEYLNPCIESIVEQSYRNLEIILVDDGSPDSCGEMCDAWKREDGRIKVLHQVNGGLSNARNNGARLATGKYLAFVDSDDIVPKDAFRLLVESLETTGSDVSTGNVKRFQGGRRWQAWNQSYSHRRDKFGSLEQDHKVARAVTLESHPELLFDTTAWNKVFRRDFFRRSKITFPEGKLYEDMLPMAQAFSAARSIDVVLDTTYLYREREDKTSITQKRGEVSNLGDKMEMVDRILNLRLDLGAPLKEVQTIVFKALEGDLPVYSPYLGRAKDFDAIYMRSLKKYWALATRETKDRLALDRRVLYLTQLFGDPSEAEPNAGEVRNRFHEIPIIAGDTGLVADIDWDPRLLGVLAPGDDASMERYVYLRQCITDARVGEGRMQLTGFAFLEYVPDPREATIEVSLRNAEGTTISLESQSFPSAEANGYWGSGIADRTDCGFRIDQSLDSIFGDVHLASTQRWDVWVSVQYRGRSWESVASGYWRGGAIRAGVSARVGTAHHGMFSWQPWGKPLAFITHPPRAEVLEVRVDDNFIDIELSPTKEEITGAAMTRSWDSGEISGKLRGTGKHGGLLVQFDAHDMADRGEAGGNLNAWRPSVTLDDGSTLYPSCATDSSSLPTESTGWEVRNNSVQELLLIDKCCLFEVSEARFEENRLILSGVNFGGDAMEHKGEFWDVDGNKIRHCEFVNLEGNRFEFRANLEVKDRFGNPAAWKPGEYRIRLWHADGTHCKQRVRSSTALLQSALPLEWTGSLCHARLHVLSDTLEFSLGIKAPLTIHERGRYNHDRMRNAWRALGDDDVTPREAVVFSVNMGGPAGDSGLAILQEMRSRDLPLEYFWAVTDTSIDVPLGVRKLVRGSSEWFELLSTARVVVNNYGGIDSYGDRAFQYYLQTWHGTPLKFIGRSEIEQESRWAAGKAVRARREAREWDALISPNKFFTSIASREFYYDGKILEIGYPRNDRLVNSTPEEKAELRASIGIPEGWRAVLYAPTWRDVGANGYASPMVEFFDPEELAEQIGEKTTVLVRGHSFNLRAGVARRESRSRVIDVTSYPDVNELMIASDVMVTDYSSIMFDYLCTGKPIVYFAPDLDEYLANRGMYMEFQDVLAGPLVQNVPDLVSELVRLDTFEERFGPQYEALAKAFVSWDDGRASSRAADAILNAISDPNRSK